MTINATTDLLRAWNIMRSILHADERGQGVNFYEAMSAAEELCCEIEARYQPEDISRP